MTRVKVPTLKGRRKSGLWVSEQSFKDWGKKQKESSPFHEIAHNEGNSGRAHRTEPLRDWLRCFRREKARA